MRIYVGGLPYQTTENDLIALFEQAGQVTEATVITDRDTGRSKGFAFVEMNNEQEAQSAIERLNGTSMGDRTITVNQARERQTTGSRGREENDAHIPAIRVDDTKFRRPVARNIQNTQQTPKVSSSASFRCLFLLHSKKLSGQ